MAITEVGTPVTNSGSGSTTTVTVNMPTGVAQNDYVLAAVESSQTVDVTCTESSGTWAKIADLYSNDAEDCNLAVFAKFMGASPDANITMTGRTTNGGIIGMTRAFRGVDLTTPQDATATTHTAANTGTPDNPAITTATANALVVLFGGSSDEGVLTNPPTNYDVLAQIQGAGRNLMSAHRFIVSPTTEDPAEWADLGVGGSDAVCSATIALRPAAEGGAYDLPADAASYTYTATAAGLEFDRLLNADAASYSWTAQDGGLEFDRQVSADAAAYAWTADDAAMEFDRQIAADSAAYAWNADDASLEYTPVGSTYSLDADSAAYLWSATDATMLHVQHYSLGADPAAYAWNAQDAVLSWSGDTAAPQGVMLRPGGITHNRKGKPRRRILLPDGRILIPADDQEYRRAVEQIVANLESGEETAEPPKRRRVLKGAVVQPAVPKLAPVQALPDEFYTALEFHRAGVLNYLSILAAWQAYLAEMDEDEAVTMLLLN